MEQKKKMKIAIIVLSVLLALSLAALGGMLIRSKLSGKAPSTVTVPDNLITPDKEPENSGSGDAGQKQADDTAAPSASTPEQSANGEKKAATIALFNKQPEDNTAFTVGNMFPGDAETKYFCVRVSYHDKVTVHFKATVRPGYEKLSEVLKIRVTLLSSGETLYDGLMKDMPASVTHALSSGESATDELYYEITDYLDTSVGNDYQNMDLVADFSWWVEETGNLDTPDTGDASRVLPWTLAAAASGCVLFLILFTRRRKEEENG